MDYYYWNAVVTRMTKNRLYMNIEELKNDIIEAMKKIPLDEIKSACLSFTSRVRKMENNYGKSINKK